MTKRITIIDYGMGNLLSVSRAFQYFGCDSLITNDLQKIRDATHLVLPGVGAFPDGMKELRKHGLVDVIRNYTNTGRFFLGICLGMQLMLDQGQEHEVTEGLGIIPGKVAAIPATTTQGVPHKIPHIGWNGLVKPNPLIDWKASLLNGIDVGNAVYFVHSFTAYPTDEATRLADCCYGGHRLCAVVRKKNIYGCQFHPEKSGPVGLQIINNFISL